MDVVLVTGADGFIGGRLVDALAGRCRKVVGTSRRVGVDRYPHDLAPPGRNPLTDPRRVERVYCDLACETHAASLMLRLKPDVVFHLAGNPRAADWSPRAVADNVLAAHHLLRYAPPGCRFVLASSVVVYGDTPAPANEDEPHRPASPYAAAKSAAEGLVRAYDGAGRVSGLSLRYAATVGGGAARGLVPDVVRKLRSDAPTLDLLGDAPGAVKPYTHVDDVVAGTVRFGLDRQIRGPVNLCNEDALSVAEVAAEAMAALGVEKPVRFLGAAANWPGDHAFVRVDAGAARWLGWAPRLTSREAVRAAARELGAA